MTKITLPNSQSDWLEHIAKTYPGIDVDQLRRSVEFANQLTSNSKQVSSTTQRGMQMVNELLKLGCDNNILNAALTYPSISQYLPEKEKVQAALGSSVSQLITGVIRMQAIELFHTEQRNQKEQGNRLRKMLLAMVDDVRAVLIKLVEKLVNLQQAREESPDIQKKLAKQARMLYAPLANRLGVGQLKWQLEDWSFRYLQPDEYQHIAKAVNMRREERESYVDNIVGEIKKLVSATHIKNASISGRAKHIYSIYRKQQRKQIDFSEIYDSIAVRALVNNLADCYTLLGAVHSHWEHIPKEFDDYIAHPKGNDYQSIHTVVIGPKKHHVEIQIRTHQMHQNAELVSLHTGFTKKDP